MTGAPTDPQGTPNDRPLPALRRLADPIRRSGVDATARLALRQFLADGDRDLGGAFGDGAAATDLVAARAALIDRVAVHVWQAWVGDRAGVALLRGRRLRPARAVPAFGRGPADPDRWRDR